MEEEGEMWRSDERRDSYHLGQREKENEGEVVEEKKKRQGEEDATAAAFVKRCKIFNPGVLSVLLCNR